MLHYTKELVIFVYHYKKEKGYFEVAVRLRANTTKSCKAFLPNTMKRKTAFSCNTIKSKNLKTLIKSCFLQTIYFLDFIKPLKRLFERILYKNKVVFCF